MRLIDLYQLFLIPKGIISNSAVILQYFMNLPTGPRYSSRSLFAQPTVNSKQSQYVYLKKLPFLPAVIIIKVLIKLNSAYGAASLPFSDVPKTKVIHTRHKKHSISLVFFLHKYRVHMVHTVLKVTVYPETKFK